ncbi:MAG: hypothetical protein ACT4P6_21750 [Gemmatimonadaceae bacterium]
MSTVVWTRRDSWCAIVLAAAACLAVVFAITPHPAGVFQDDGAYVVLAKALAEGNGYHYINLPNAPGATHFPPLYPLLLAGLWKIGPEFPANVQMFKFANALLLGVATAGAFVFARRKLGMDTGIAAFAAAAACISAPLVGIARMVLSEPTFLAVLLPMLFLVERSADKGGGGARSAVFAGLAGGALGLLRTLGVFLVPATAFVLVTRRRWRDAAIVLACGALVLAPWQLWSAAHADALATPIAGKYGSYSSWLIDGMREGGPAYVATVFRENAEFTGTFLAGSFGLATAPMAARYALVIAVLVFLAFGARELWRRVPVTTVFLAAYLVVVLVWPFPPDRFYWGIWPLLVFAFAVGVRTAWQSTLITPRVPRLLVAAVVTPMVLLYVGPQVLGTSRPWVWGIQGIMTDRSRPIVQWVNSYTRPNDIVATEDDVMVYLYTGRITVPVGAFTPREHVDPQTREFTRASVQTLIQAYPVRWLIPVTWQGIQASADLSRDTSTGVHFRGKLPLGAVFERVPLTGEDR